MKVKKLLKSRTWFDEVITLSKNFIITFEKANPLHIKRVRFYNYIFRVFRTWACGWQWLKLCSSMTAFHDLGYLQVTEITETK